MLLARRKKISLVRARPRAGSLPLAVAVTARSLLLWFIAAYVSNNRRRDGYVSTVKGLKG